MVLLDGTRRPSVARQATCPVNGFSVYSLQIFKNSKQVRMKQEWNANDGKSRTRKMLLELTEIRQPPKLDRAKTLLRFTDFSQLSLKIR